MARILATLRYTSNAETPYRLLLICEKALIDDTVSVILPAAMTLRLKLPTSPLLLIVATFFICGLLAPDTVAQRLPKATDREPQTKSASVRRERRKKARQ